MPRNVAGIVTARDGLVIAFDAQELAERIGAFTDPTLTDGDVRIRFFGNKGSGSYLPGDTRGWKLPIARRALQQSEWRGDIQSISYRPFDTRAILSRSDMVDWGRVSLCASLVRVRI